MIWIRGYDVNYYVYFIFILFFNNWLNRHWYFLWVVAQGGSIGPCLACVWCLHCTYWWTTITINCVIIITFLRTNYVPITTYLSYWLAYTIILYVWTITDAITTRKDPILGRIAWKTGGWGCLAGQTYTITLYTKCSIIIKVSIITVAVIVVNSPEGSIGTTRTIVITTPTTTQTTIVA